MKARELFDKALAIEKKRSDLPWILIFAPQLIMLVLLGGMGVCLGVCSFIYGLIDTIFGVGLKDAGIIYGICHCLVFVLYASVFAITCMSENIYVLAAIREQSISMINAIRSALKLYIKFPYMALFSIMFFIPMALISAYIKMYSGLLTPIILGYFIFFRSIFAYVGYLAEDIKIDSSYHLFFMVFQAFKRSWWSLCKLYALVAGKAFLAVMGAICVIALPKFLGSIIVTVLALLFSGFYLIQLNTIISIGRALLYQTLQSDIQEKSNNNADQKVVAETL